MTMKRNRVSLGEPNRPPPTQGYARKRAAFDAIGKKDSEASLLKNSATNKTWGGVGSPLREGDTPPDFSGTVVEEIQKLWKKLPQPDKKKLLALLSLDLQTSDSPDARDVDMWGEAVYEAICATLGPSDGAAHGPQVVRRLMVANAAWSPFAEFMEVGRMNNLRPAEKYAVFRLLAKLLVARARRVAQRADIPLTPKLVAQNVQHIRGIFDNAFPGYLANGLVGSVSRMLIGNPTAVARVMS
jgi:hypothetical protein